MVGGVEEEGEEKDGTAIPAQTVRHMSNKDKFWEKKEQNRIKFCLILYSLFKIGPPFFINPEKNKQRKEQEQRSKKIKTKCGVDYTTCAKVNLLYSHLNFAWIYMLTHSAFSCHTWSELYFFYFRMALTCLISCGSWFVTHGHVDLSELCMRSVSGIS